MTATSMLFSPSVEAMSQVGREHAEFLFQQQFTVPVVEAHRVFVAGPNIGDWWLMAGPGRPHQQLRVRATRRG